MSRGAKRPALRIPRRLVSTALHVAVAGALGCGHDASPARDAAVAHDAAAHDAAVAHDAAAADLRGATQDGCTLTVFCMPVVAGADCSGTFCSVRDCPFGCEPYV